MRYLYLAFGLALITSSCSKKSDAPASPVVNDSLAAANYLDVSYGTDNKQKLDVHLPAMRDTRTRLVVIIHGGGWNSGDKSDFNDYIEDFQKRLPDYAFANLNYRLVSATGNFFPTQENDVKSAITFLKSKTADYAISDDFILLGVSAGAHLAQLQAYKHSDILPVRGVVSFFGPSDLERLYLNSDREIPAQLQFILNATLDINPNIFYESSPLNYVTSNAPPTLLLHGDADKIVPVEQAYMLQDKLEEKGVSNKLIVYPGLAHGWVGADRQNSFDEVAAFIKGLSN